MIAGNGHTNVARLIKERCVDSTIFKNMIDGMNELRNTPLHWAVLNNQLEFVKFLIENGAETSTKNSDAQTALDVAIDSQSEEMIV